MRRDIMFRHSQRRFGDLKLSCVAGAARDEYDRLVLGAASIRATEFGYPHGHIGSELKYLLGPFADAPQCGSIWLAATNKTHSYFLSQG